MTTTVALGDLTLHRIVEMEVPMFEPAKFLKLPSPEILEANRAWMEPTYLDPKTGLLVLAVQSYLVKTPHHTILIDSCVGNHKPRPARPMWDMMTSDRYATTLKAAGIGFEDVDFVMCTHLHVDHVGWNTRLDNGRWVPTFPKARYLFSGKELDFWTERHTTNPELVPWITDSVLPIVAAGCCDRVTSDYRLNELVGLVPTPGHTIDHFAVHVGSKGRDAYIVGDMVHSPLQVKYPDMGMYVDFDSVQAGQSRRKIYEACCDTATLLCTAHFPSPSLGHIRRAGDTFDYVPMAAV